METNKDIFGKPSWKINTEVLIVGNDHGYDDGTYDSYATLSYVSYGEYKDCDIEIATENYVRKSKLRGSRDIEDVQTGIKLADKRGLKLWVDEISIVKENYQNKQDNFGDRDDNGESLQMRAIGDAYKMSDITICTLQPYDVAWLQNVNNVLLEISEGKGEQLNIITNKSIMDDLNEYSYWTRAWTAQETHQSKRVEYVGSRETQDDWCLSSDDLTFTIGKALMMAHTLEEPKKTVALSIIGQATALLPGRQYLLIEQELNKMAEMSDNKLDVSSNNMNNRRRKESMDYAFVKMMSATRRSARNVDEFVNAASIALGIYEPKIHVAWNLILKRVTEMGFIKRIQSTMTNTRNGWCTQKVNITNKEKVNNTNIDMRYVSLLFTQLVWDRATLENDIAVNNGGGLVTNAITINMKILAKEVVDDVNKYEYLSGNFGNEQEFIQSGDYVVYKVNFIPSVVLKKGVSEVKYVEKGASVVDTPRLLSVANTESKMATAIVTINNDLVINNDDVLRIVYMGPNSLLLDKEGTVIGGVCLIMSDGDTNGYNLDKLNSKILKDYYRVIPGVLDKPWWEAETRIKREEKVTIKLRKRVQ